MSDTFVAIAKGICGFVFVWCIWLYLETIKGIDRARFDRIDRELRDALRGKENFFVLKGEEDG